MLGLAGAVDLEIVWSSDVMEELVARHGISIGDLDRDRRIVSERDLVSVILSFLADGGGGERHVAASGIIEQFASQFDSSRRPRRHTVAPRWQCIHWVCRASFTSSPSTTPSGDCCHRRAPTSPVLAATAPIPTSSCSSPRVRACGSATPTYRAPRANRLIFTHDPPAEMLRISDELGTALADARVFLVSSLNAIRDGHVLEARLAQLRQYMERLPSDAFVYYEDAGFHDPALSKQAADGLHGAVDVHGMNEDEMQVHLGHQVDLLDADATAEALTELPPLRRRADRRRPHPVLGALAGKRRPALRASAAQRDHHGDEALPPRRCPRLAPTLASHDPSIRQVRFSLEALRATGWAMWCAASPWCTPTTPQAHDDRSRRHLRRRILAPLVEAGA